MVYIAEFLLYISFALALGISILELIPKNYKPTIEIPKPLFLICILSIPILTYIPLHMNALQFMSSFQLDYISMMKSILLDLQSGEAWVWITVGALGLAVITSIPVFKKDRHMPKVAFLLMLLLCFWQGYGSHVASLDAFKGLIAHTGHFITIAIWLGILFVVSWFAKDDEHWDNYIRWFSPLAIACVLIALIAGITLMSYTVPSYSNALMLNYGQLLLLKHASIIPLLWLAFSNGFIYRKFDRKNGLSSQRKLMRSESIIALLVLGFTATMSQSAPPHNVLETLRTETPSSLFTTIFREPFSPDLQLTWSINLSSALLLVSSLLLLYSLTIAFKHRNHKAMILLSLLMIGLLYMGVMFGIHAVV